MNERCLAICVLAKFPSAGNTKTRLAVDVGDRLAVSLYEELLLNTILQIKKISIPYDLFAVSSDFAHKKSLEEFLSGHLPVIFYENESVKFVSPLIKAVFNDFLLSRKYKKVIVTCSDSPFVGSKTMLEASRALDENNLLFISPASDGCYSVIGLNNYQDIFSVSDRKLGESVVDKTINLAKEAGLKTYLSNIVDDIDIKDNVYSALPLLNEDNDPGQLIKKKFERIINIMEK